MSKHGKSLLNDAFIRQAKLAKERQHYRDQRGPRISLKIAARDKKAAERPIVMSVQWQPRCGRIDASKHWRGDGQLLLHWQPWPGYRSRVC
jgi:hypothetical protein